MKKKVALMIAVVMLIGILPVIAYAGQSLVFKDVKDTDWFKPFVDEMSEKGICEGYGNGLYGSQDYLQVDQLLKMVIIAMGYNPEVCDTDAYWGCKYIKQAKELGLIKDGEFSNYEVNIKRGEIARIIARGLSETFPDNLDDYKVLIKDYDSVKADYQQYILKVYCKGIVNGYPDGRFGTNDNATRAEASKMIINLINPDKRIEPVLPVAGTEVIRGYIIPVQHTVAIDTGSEKAELLIAIVLHKPIDSQIAEAETILKSKFDSTLVQQIIGYAKSKVDPDIDIARRSFENEKHRIEVVGSGWSISITVYKK